MEALEPRELELELPCVTGHEAAQGEADWPCRPDKLPIQSTLGGVRLTEITKGE